MRRDFARATPIANDVWRERSSRANFPVTTTEPSKKVKSMVAIEVYTGALLPLQTSMLESTLGGCEQMHTTRYTTSTILTLLQEVYNTAGSKVDWTSIVKNSSTGINSAREYQTLWRHLAYRVTFPDNVECDGEPLEDESDLEFEVEPLPGVGPDVASNVAACVKILAASGSVANTSSKNQEASFVIDIPNSSSGWEVRGNGQVSNVIVQGANTPENQPARKKRKLWTSEEDQELIAAVEKCGEGNWATMLKGAFKHERTAAQLSQRWALIRKRRDSQTGISQNNTIDNQPMVTGLTTSVSTQLPVETANVLPAAADCQKDCTPVTSTAGVGNVAPLPASASKSILVQDQNCNDGSTPSLAQPAGKGRPPMKRPAVSVLQQSRAANPTPGLVSSSSGQGTGVGGDLRSTKSVIPSLPSSGAVPARYSVSSGIRNTAVSSVGRQVPKSSAGPDPMIQAAAVAAGARIAPASAAASLLKAAHAGNVVHIGPGGVSMGKAGSQTQTNGNAACTTVKAGSGVGTRTSTGALVHYIRTGTGSSQSLHQANQRASQAKGQFVKSGSPQVARPNASAISSPGPSGPLQKALTPTFMPASGMREKTSSVLPNEGHSIANDATTTKSSERCLDGSSPFLEGITKVKDQDLATNCPNDSASESLPLGQNVVAEKGCLPKSNEVADVTCVTAPSIILETKEDPSASSLIQDKATESNSKDRPQDPGPSKQ
ncbi:hypothetical protein GOP47_0013848 [Adiantum capillus-veneris]|uniref:Homeodomain-like superfamily protein n=1 Tax=Adiantum capillus-veneris TaxID=13818 RepID=A0A9D4UPS9_ADICA|nr:hypothetical protein GOP47_0013848 [Adiantum capillus-veneris]